MPPQPAWQPPPRPPRPAQLEWACRLLVLNVVLGLIALFITLTHKDEFRREYLRRTPTLSDADVDRFFTISLVIGVIFGVAGGLFYLFLAYKMWHGRNWARITTWVFTGLGVFGLVTAFIGPSIAISRVIVFVGALIDIAVIIVLALRPSNEFFRKPAPPAYYYPYPPQ